MYLSQQKAVIKQFSRCITTMAKLDFPQNWPTLLPNIVECLNTKTEKHILTGLIALHGLVKHYEFQLEPEREQLYTICDACFVILGSLVDQLIGQSDNEEALHIFHLICKVFYAANQLQVVPGLKEVDKLKPWLEFFKTMMELNVPEALGSPEEDMNIIADRDKSYLWKIKGMACRITYRLFSKYGKPEYIVEQD